MPRGKVRNAGSYTSVNYGGRPIAWLDSFFDGGQPALGQPEPITPLGDKYPREIVTPTVLTLGNLTFSIRELWDSPVWWQLEGLRGTETITDVWEAFARLPQAVTVTKIIRDPAGRSPLRGTIYHGVLISGIPDAEQVNVQTLSLAKDVNAVYTHKRPLTT